MCDISSTTGSTSDSETSGENRDLTDSFTRKAFYENLIEKANSVPLPVIFKHYGVRLDNNTLKTTCPFPSHKGGRERTPSFNYYPNTNTYHCFGCKKGSTCSDFVAEKEHLSKINAAYKIVELFEVNDDISFHDSDNFLERFRVMQEFSNLVRNFRQLYNDTSSFQFIEGICIIYDNINLKYDLDVKALRKLVDKLKKRIELYKPLEY